MNERANSDSMKSVPIDVLEKLDAWLSARGIAPGEREIVYLSTAMTTGPLFQDWYRREGQFLSQESEQYRVQHQSDVVLPNIQRVLDTAELLQFRLGEKVTNPTAFDVPEWNSDQDKYHAFWEQVIRRHVKKFILLSGWQFSFGCTHEFAVAKEQGIECRWPNDFSRFLGDKTFGLLVADAINLPVPCTIAFGRAR